jgi:uncharacterized Zn finger protein
MTLDQILTQELVRELAGPAYFERGEGYVADRRVLSLSDDNGAIAASVAGTEDYRVRISSKDGGLLYSCDCPIGLRGEFCKHCVAVSLQWLSTDRGDSSDIRGWLNKQDKKTLIDLLDDRALFDAELHQVLSFNAAAADFSVAVQKKLIREAIGRRRFVDYRAMPAYARRIDAAVDNLEALFQDGIAEPLVGLCEYALRRVESAIGHVDDSDGYMSPILGRLEDLHLVACERARPEPKKLAKRLYNWQIDGDWDTFRDAAEKYAAVLGDAGLRHYRKLAEAQWASIPPLAPGEDDPDRYGQRFRITSIMESLARQGDDFEAWIDVKKRDLSVAYSFLQIAEACFERGLVERAIEWAEDGRSAFANKVDHRLGELLVRLYHDSGRHAKAMDLQWGLFAKRPHLQTFARLKQSADQLQRWPDWRQRAITLIDEQISRATIDRTPGRRRFDPFADRSLPVEILLWEGDAETAWEQACDGGCNSGLWLQLAGQRETAHPRDAVKVYRKLVPDIVNQTNNKAYAEALKLVTRVGKLYQSLGASDEFATYIQSLRDEFRRK